MLKFLWNSTPEEMNTQDNTSKEKKLPSLHTNTQSQYTHVFPHPLPYRQETERVHPLEVKHISPKVSLVGYLAPNIDQICDDAALASWTWSCFHSLDLCSANCVTVTENRLHWLSSANCLSLFCLQELDEVLVVVLGLFLLGKAAKYQRSPYWFLVFLTWFPRTYWFYPILFGLLGTFWYFCTTDIH